MKFSQGETCGGMPQDALSTQQTLGADPKKNAFNFKSLA
jgi:hypothetical protein